MGLVSTSWVPYQTRRTLVCKGLNVTNLGPLAGLTGLRHLNCARMTVVDLAPLAALTGLQSLNIRCTPAIDRAPLACVDASRSRAQHGSLSHALAAYGVRIFQFICLL